MNDRYIVVRDCMLSYGSQNKAWVTLNKGQIWELRAYPSKRFPWYSLTRYSVTIDIVQEDFERIFKQREGKDDGSD